MLEFYNPRFMALKIISGWDWVEQRRYGTKRDNKNDRLARPSHFDPVSVVEGWDHLDCDYYRLSIFVSYHHGSLLIPAQGVLLVHKSNSRVLQPMDLLSSGPPPGGFWLHCADGEQKGCG